MISDSIPNASIFIASSDHRDFAKKRKVNRSAKLKQCKLDARREQWLSQAKTKDRCGDELKFRADAHRVQLMNLENKGDMSTEKMDIKARGDEENYGDGSLIHHYSGSESSHSNSPTSHSSSVLGSNHSGTIFTSSSRSCSSSSSRSSSSNGYFLEIMSEEEIQDVGDDGCLDDWEALADALAATDKKKHEHSLCSAMDSPSLVKYENCAKSTYQSQITNKVIDISNAKPESGGTAMQKPTVNCRAWRADDASRPQCLPTLLKQYSFPLNSEQRFDLGRSAWSGKSVGSIPMACPICYEDLDCTDWRFRPCLCGFRICLFCHKRILEEDGRCPGCRKLYDHSHIHEEAILDGGRSTRRIARSCSMITRS